LTPKSVAAHTFSPPNGFAFKSAALKLHLIVIVVVLVAWLALPPSAFSALGKSQDSINHDKTLLKTKEAKVQLHPKYLCQVLNSEKLTVKEYIDPRTHVVFGVSWTGSQVPPLKELLGFDPNAIKTGHVVRSLHFAHIVTSSITLKMSTIMNHYAGSVVRTDLIPKGVTSSEVKP
jgi:hypothetical protein